MPSASSSRPAPDSRTEPALDHDAVLVQQEHPRVAHAPLILTDRYAKFGVVLVKMFVEQAKRTNDVAALV